MKPAFYRKKWVALKKEKDIDKLNHLARQIALSFLDRYFYNDRHEDDYIELRFASGAPYDVVHLHIWQRGDDWVSLVNRTKAAEFDATRAIPIDKKVAEKVKNAPTQCPECGGAVNQPILRGMESITCEYCGVVIRW